MESFADKIYPYLSDTLVDMVCQNFNLGKLVSWQGIAGGWSNLNIKVETSDGLFVVRFYRFGARSLEDINLEFTVLEKLKSDGLPVVPAVLGKNGEKVMEEKLGAKKVYLAAFEYINGEQHLNLNKAQLYEIGLALSRIHQSLLGFPSGHIRKYWRFKSELGKVKRRINKRSRARMWSFDDKISLANFTELINLESADFLKFAKKFEKNLRAVSIIHGDFHAANVKFEGKKIVGIFDFDSIMHGPTVLDLAICISNLKLQSEENQSEYTLFNIYNEVLKGYQKRIKLSTEQKTVLPILVRFWLFSQFAWILKQPQSSGQAYFYGQVLDRVLKVLKEKEVEVN